MDIDIKKDIIRGAQIIDDRIPWSFERDQYMNASEADSCIRRQWFQKHQPKVGEPQQWGYARRGQNAERYIVEALKAVNAPLLFAGDEQVSIQDDKRRISGTPDGVLAYDKEWIGVEFKSIDPRTNRSRLPRAGHVTQLQLCMALLQDRVPKGVKMTRGVIVYMDASNFDDIVEFPVDAKPGILDEMAPRAKKILDTQRLDILDREGKRNGTECKTCPFKAPCGVDISDTPLDGRKRANRGSNFDDAAKRFMEIKDTETVLEEEKKGLAEDIKLELAKRGTSKAVVGDIVVDLQVTKGRTTFDKAAAKKAGVDIAAFEKTGAPSERLTVTRIE